MKTMKHKYNTTLILSVFPPSPLSNTMSDTANNHKINVWETKEIQKFKKKFNFPWTMSAHPQCTDLEKKWMNATICGNAFHVTTRAFVKVKNTATNFANNPKKNSNDGKGTKWRTQNFWKKNVENNSQKNSLQTWKNKITKRPKPKVQNYLQRWPKV